MDVSPILESVTPLGLVALMIVLGYYAVNKLSTIQANHYERQTELLNQLNVTMMACLDRLQGIENELDKR